VNTGVISEEILKFWLLPTVPIV